MRKQNGFPLEKANGENRNQNKMAAGRRCCLNELLPGQSARVLGLSNTGNIRRRLLDMGLVEHTRVECRMQSPGNGPTAYVIRGAVVAIRKADGAEIFVLRENEEEQDLKQQQGEIIWD